MGGSDLKLLHSLRKVLQRCQGTLKPESATRGAPMSREQAYFNIPVAGVKGRESL